MMSTVIVIVPIDYIHSLYDGERESFSVFSSNNTVLYISYSNKKYFLIHFGIFLYTALGNGIRMLVEFRYS